MGQQDLSASGDGRSPRRRRHHGAEPDGAPYYDGDSYASRESDPYAPRDADRYARRDGDSYAPYDADRHVPRDGDGYQPRDGDLYAPHGGGGYAPHEIDPYAPQDAERFAPHAGDEHATRGAEGHPHDADGAASSGDGAAPQSAAPATGRAGRNLPMAIAVGCGLGAVVLASLLIYRPAFAVLVAIAAGVGLWELVRAIGTRHKVPLIPLVAGGAGMAAMAWFGGAESLVLGLGLTIVVVMAWRLADGPANYLGDMLASVLAAVWVPFLAGFAVLLVKPDDGQLRIIVTLALVVLSDTGGYVAGVLFGKHPMAPKVSPKKSWEGMGGSIVACAVGGALMLYFAFDVTWWKGALFGLAITIVATLGDLTESMVKRDLGVKDMSGLIPGHGGLMDRLDSILLAAPTAVLLLTALAPPA